MNQNHTNYQRCMEDIIQESCCDGKVPSLLLHSCCAPCSSYCLEYLSRFFSITVYYYNPNIYPDTEYELRVREQENFIRNFPCTHAVSFEEETYDPDTFYQMAKGMEQLPEGGERCFSCYRLRLRKAAEYARQHQYDFFTTTLSISPMKNAEKLNEIGACLEKEYGVRYLFSDFKKNAGYQRSTEITKEYGMYRQYYCGCVFSKMERDARITKRKAEGNAAEVNGTEGNRTEGNGTEGNGTEGNRTEGNGTGGNGTEGTVQKKTVQQETLQKETTQKEMLQKDEPTVINA